METIDYVRYLKAKVPVDDRSLNQHVFDNFTNLIRSRGGKSVLRVVDIGAGIGAVLFRLLEARDVFEGYTSVVYTLVDVKAEVLNAARVLALRRLLQPQGGVGFESEVTEVAQSRVPSINQSQSVHHAGLDERNRTSGHPISDVTVPGAPALTVRFCRADAQSFLLKNLGMFDAVVAAGFLDLFSLDDIIPLMQEGLDKKSTVRAFYFPITFDGVTSFSPLEARTESDWNHIIEFFHESMGSGHVCGQCVPRAHSGRSLNRSILQAGGEVCSFGPSTWIVERDERTGAYPNDEAYFLECIFRFIKSSITEDLYKKIARSTVERALATIWEKLESQTIRYKASNCDVSGFF